VFYFPNGKFNVDTKTMLFCPSGVDYQQTPEGEKLVAIHLLVHSDCKFKAETIAITPKAQETFLTIYELFSQKEKGYKYRAHALLSCFLAEFISDSNWAKNYIEKNLSNANLTVKQIAEHEHVSEQFFRKKFKNTYGVSPKQYILDKRIERAKSLLDTGYYKVNEVARLVGIEDNLYFSTLFKKHVGITPSNYIGKN
jgi:AraC-like DNA-binding protein